MHLTKSMRTNIKKLETIIINKTEKQKNLGYNCRNKPANGIQ